MGKKVKTGKARKDKFYQLAKESGYRARSAFKLLQLNRKFEFLQKSRVCIDLCAAPGGWLQVAAQNMPVSSVIIGVDLMPIRPIPKCITFQEDITSAKCRQILKKELHEWAVDVVLNDGAPNVGSNWIHDAFMQAELTLAALKLATEFLRKGGWFVTKVFRSKDYHALMWVFNQLFKKVFATKPQASRNESAEIFVVCQGFIKPDKLDAKFLDPKYVFKEVEEEKKDALNILYPVKAKKAKAEGYADGDMTLHHSLKASEFIAAENFLELLGDANEVKIDDDEIMNHADTTPEIKACLADIKVLGKKEIRGVLAWRKKIIAHLKAKQEEEAAEEEGSGQEEDEEAGSSEEEDEEDEEEKINAQIEELKEAEVKDAKKKKKKVLKEKKKLRDKMNLKMVIKGDHLDIGEDMELFNIKKIKSKQQLAEVGKEEMIDESSESEDEELAKDNKVSYDRHGDAYDYPDYPSEEEEDDEANDTLGGGDDEDDDEEEEAGSDTQEESSNPLVVDLDTTAEKAAAKTSSWFSKDVFSGLEGDDDEDIEIEKMADSYKKKGGSVIEVKKDAKKKKKRTAADVAAEEEVDSGNASDLDADDDDDDDEDSDSDTDSDGSDYDFQQMKTKSAQNGKDKDKKSGKAEKDGFEIVSKDYQPAGKIRKLDAEGLALGAEMIKSSKRRREIIEMSYNRYTHNDDEGVPEWFKKDEDRHSKMMMPVTKEEVDEYKERLKAINARPIKKVAESKARKKKKQARKLEKARKKAEVISDTVDVSDKEKMQQIKQVYKRAGLLKKKKEEVSYVVAKRGVGRKVSRPAGVKGKFKVVDPRMKKDLRAAKNKEKTKGRGKKGGKGKK